MNTSQRRHLRLLGVLEALLLERNVTRAAQRLHLSQPALSSALAQLREIFQDPLLVKNGRTLVLTPKAESLVPQLDTVMNLVAQLMGSGEFEPRQLQRCFTIAVSDAVGQLLMPQVIAHLASVAPGVNLRLVIAPRDLPQQQLASQELDMLVAHHERAGTDLHCQTLYQQQLCAVVRQGHPELGKLKRRLQLQEFVSTPQVTIFPHAPELDQAIRAAYTLAEKPYLLQASTQHISVAASIVAKTNAMALMPEGLAHFYRRSFHLKVLALPVQMLLPEMPINLIWHERTQHDAAHLWLRQIICTCSEQEIKELAARRKNLPHTS